MRHDQHDEDAVASLRVLGLAAALIVLLYVSAARGAAAAAKNAFGGTHLELRPKFLRPCPDVRGNALDAVHMGFEFLGRTTVVIAFNTTMNRSTEKWSKIRMTIEQCDRDQAVSSTSCTPFRTIDFSDPCGMMMNPSMPWARVVADVQPKLRCPVDKGRYTLSNGTVSMDLLNAMRGTLRLEGPLWRFQSNCLDARGATHLCVDGAGEFFRVRDRPKSSSG